MFINNFHYRYVNPTTHKVFFGKENCVTIEGPDIDTRSEIAREIGYIIGKNFSSFAWNPEVHYYPATKDDSKGKLTLFWSGLSARWTFKLSFDCSEKMEAEIKRGFKERHLRFYKEQSDTTTDSPIQMTCKCEGVEKEDALRVYGVVEVEGKHYVVAKYASASEPHLRRSEEI